MSDPAKTSNSTTSVESGRHKLISVSFVALLLTQFLGATNDNIFRWLVIGIGKQFVEHGNPASILMAGTVCFVLPYLLLASVAGYLADRFSKRSVIICCKAAELAIMGLGVLAILSGQMWCLFVAVALMGAQSALFSPAKSGSIPEMLKPERISAANGLFGLATVVATVIGAAAGNLLTDWTAPKGQNHWWLSAAVLLGVAAAGWACSLFICRLQAANPKRMFPWDSARQTVRDFRKLASQLPLLRVAFGIAFFWSLGTLANLNIDQFAFEGGASRQGQIVPLLLSLVLGVGVGSILAGILSGDHVELGLLPLGAGGVAISSLSLFTIEGTLISGSSTYTSSFVVACFLLFLLGCSAGLFNVPLEAFMQHRSPRASRGSILAAGNCLTFCGILVASIVFWGLRKPWLEGHTESVTAAADADLSSEDVQRVAEVHARFAERWRPPREASIGAFIAEVPDAAREALLARLLWTEMVQRRETGEKIKLEEFAVRFPEDGLLVEHVFKHSVGRPLCSSRQVFLLSGVLTIPVFIYIVFLIPQASVRFVVWLASHTVYRIRVFDRGNLPESGGALLVANHVSWLDGIFLLLTSSRLIRFVVDAGSFNNAALRWLATKWGAILISSGPKSIVLALNTAQQALRDGQLVCIFPEGGITRSGQIQAFRPGLMRVLKGTQAPVIPVYLDELWGSIFSFERGKFFWKLPRRWRHPVSIHFGKPAHAVQDIHQVRQAVQYLGAEAVQKRKKQFVSLPRAMIRMCKRRKFKAKVADSAGTKLTGGQLLMRTWILRRLLTRHVFDADEQFVGLLLPPTAGGLIANLAVTLDQRIAVNLNYTVSSEVMNQCISQSGIRHVLTSRRFMEKMDFSLDAELVYLEDFRSKVTLADKLSGALAAYVVPSGLLGRRLNLGHVDCDDVVTVIFTSGSTGTPKGVMLTYANVASNVQAIEQVVHLRPTDVVLGILPYFHSFGYTVTLWTAIATDIMVVYHFNPLEAKQIAKMAKRHGATILLATPTFLRHYIRRCDAEDFAALEVVVAGAEKLPLPLSDAFEERFGIRPVEGYGTTELSPIVSVNIPPSRSIDNFQTDRKEGTVGRPVPGVTAKIVDMESGADLGAGETGMLLVKGPNVMKGYLNQPDKTGEVMRDGWYVTGDVAMIDEEGFIQITGRESRFSKIGGEMVPHIQIEDVLNGLIGSDEENGVMAAVTAVPDAKKGERLVVVHKPIEMTADQLRAGLSQAGLPNIYIPSGDSFHQVDELPILGTGKLDLRAIKEIAMERFGAKAV